MKCSICGKPLSDYNHTDKCWAHQVPPDYDWKKADARLLVGAGSTTDRPFIATQLIYNGGGGRI